MNKDVAELKVNGASIKLIRLLSYDHPHEVSAYIPRVEMRRRRFSGGHLVWEEEIILNSLTLVHAPLHPPAAPGSSPRLRLKFC